MSRQEAELSGASEPVQERPSACTSPPLAPEGPAPPSPGGAEDPAAQGDVPAAEANEACVADATAQEGTPACAATAPAPGGASSSLPDAEVPAVLLPALCPSDHELQRQPVGAGSCDGCLKLVRHGELAMACASCNWYLCTTCHPPQCPAGHALCSSVAGAGMCDGCGRKVRRGEKVMDCSQCNWYLCTTCRPPDLVKQCPSGHGLQLWANQRDGTCDGCGELVDRGDLVMDCRRCNWFLCAACHPQEKALFGGLARSTAIAALPTPTKHVARSQPMEEGSSSQVTQCVAGHALQPWAASAGQCDGCGRPVRAGQMVMDCRTCNWYLCSMCHLTPVRSSFF